MRKEIHLKQTITLILLLTISIIFLTSCSNNEAKKYQHAEVYLNCENYSETQNDPGNCLVISGTTEGLRIRPGMVVTKKYVLELMSDLGWEKDGQSSKYADLNGFSYKVEIFQFERELE
jgi:hypothetical protein